jgi:hypothetical protein
MAIKPFEIQSSTLTIGGVDLQAGNTSVVIPGVTQATNYKVEDVNDTGDQTLTFESPPLIIDYARWQTFQQYGNANGNTFAEFMAQLDDDGYIDEIAVDSAGSYSPTLVEMNEGNDMFIYSASAVDPFNPFVDSDWTQIPFRPKMRAGEVETIGGGGSTGNITFDGNTISSQEGYPTLVNAEGSDGGVEIDYDSETVSHAMWLNGEDGLQIQINRHLEEGQSNWHFSTDGALTFPDGTKQTTAYTGQSGGSTSTLYVAVNSDGRSFTSSDGISWTEYTTNMLGVGRVAVGPNMIVYTANAVDVSNGDGGALWYASTDTPGTVTEVTGFSGFSFEQVKYFASIEKFVAVGSNTDNLPVILYSSNGTSWIQVDLDSGFLAAFDNGAGFQGNAQFYDIETNGVGFLLTTSNNNLGAFYTTDITTPMGQNSWIDFSGLGLEYPFTRIAYAAAGEFTGWHIMQNNGPDSDAWYYNNNIDPTYGGFSQFAIGDIGSAFAAEVNYEPDVSEVVFGAYNDITTIMIATTNGQILYWPAIPDGPWVSIPKPYTATDFSINQSSTAAITFGNYSANTNEKIVLSNCTPSDYNGTYYVGSGNMLYTDSGVSSAFDSSGLGAFISGTLTFSHGQYIDALHYSGGKFYAGNDDEEMFVSTNGGATWILADTFTGSPGEPDYMNDIDSYVTTTSGSSLTNGAYSFTLNSDGTITLPTIGMTSYEPGYTINGPTFQMGNDPTVGETIITGPAPNSNNPSARRLIIQGQRGFGGWGDSAVGEGGDIYLWAGTGGENGNGNVGSGGDIKIRGGVGQAGTEGGAWTEGGYVKIEGGDVQWGYGTGGFVEINAGSTSQGLGGLGDGGDVTIRAGLGSVNNGEVHIYTSSNGNTYDNEWVFKNDGSLQLPSGTPLNADLNGYGNDPGTGFKYTFTADFYGLQSNGMGTITGVVLSDGFISTIVAGCIITFRNGETRIINGGTTDGQDTGAALYTWDGAEVVSEWTNPAFPITIESGDYVPSTKKTAKINPDTDYVSLGQYMEIYTGGAPSTMDDLGHIHMKGHTGNVELFLGTDDNFVSSKEAGTTPGHVSMRSETEIKVIETALRTTRNGSTFVSDYGDNYNYLWALDNYNDISHNCVTTDPDGNYYIGGEHHTTADAMISKFSKDGELIWSKLVGSDAWNANAIAYNPALGQVGVACTANPDRSHEYIKLVTFTSDGQEVSTRDFYDVDNSIYATDMASHPTLGWIVSANSYGEEVVKAGLTPQTGSGVGLLILDASATTILGDLMSAPDTSWKISGTNIMGKQTLGSAIGAFTNISLVNDTVANPAAGGAVITVRIDYKNGVYYDISEVTAVGSNYTAGDTLRVTGNLLGGTTPTNDVVFTITENGSGGLQGGTAAGTPSLSTIRLDMTAIGFTTEDFSTGTYSIHRQVSQRPVVLTSTWRKFLDLEDGDAYTEGWSTTVYVDSANNVFVGGAMNSSINGGSGCGYVWKLNSSGVTQWVSGLASSFNVTSIATDSYGAVYASTANYYGGGNEIYKLDNQGAYSLYRYANGPYGAWSAHLDIARDETGDEYLYVGLSGFYAMFSNTDGFAVQKFDLGLTPVWARYMEMSNGQGMWVDYANNFQHFALTSTQAAIVGYSDILGTDYDNGMISSLCITNDFVADTEGTSGIITKTVDLAWSFDSAPTITDLIALGVEGLDSSAEYEANPATLTWYNHRFQCRIINGNYEVKGIVGVDNIKFINGDNLDHNPSDIPESTQNVQLNWEITLTPGDRGKFIKNQHAPGVGWVQNLTINVPKSDAEFPVGSIITLLNLDTSDGYRIYVQPVDWGQSSAARIWATGYLNPSIWSFGGMQTATLMKISPDDWLLTANNISNED